MALERRITRRSGKKVVLIQPNDCKAFELTTYTVELSKEHQYDKKNTYITYFGSNLLTRTTIEIDKSIPDEIVEESIIQKTYDELKIEPEIPCIIKYLPRGLNYDETKKEFDVYLLENSTVMQRFSACATKFPYIDYIIPVPFLFLSLYSAEIVQKEGVHVFIYFTPNDAFFNIFEDGKLLYFKPLSITMNKLFETFNLYSTESIDFDTFSRILNGEYGAQTNKTAMNKMFEECASSIEEVMIYVKRVFSISVVNNLYVDSDGGFNNDFYEFLGSYLGVNCSKYNFDYGITGTKGVTHIGMLAFLCAKEYEKGLESNFNFTIYYKPKPFPQRDAGHIIIAAAASFLIAFSYPVYNYITGALISVKNSALQEEVVRLNSEYGVLKSRVDTLTYEKQRKSDIFARASKRTDEQKNILYGIYDNQKEYTLKTEAIVELVDDVLKSGIKLNKIKMSDGNQLSRAKSVVLDVNSIEHKKITDFIKMVADNRKYSVSVNDIYYDTNSSRYLSRVNITLR